MWSRSAENICIYMYIYTYVYVHTYIYIYTKICEAEAQGRWDLVNYCAPTLLHTHTYRLTDRERARERVRELEWESARESEGKSERAWESACTVKTQESEGMRASKREREKGSAQERGSEREREGEKQRYTNMHTHTQYVSISKRSKKCWRESTQRWESMTGNKEKDLRCTHYEKTAWWPPPTQSIHFSKQLWNNPDTHTYTNTHTCMSMHASKSMWYCPEA